MVNRFLFRIFLLLAFAAGMGACTSEAVNRDRMVNLDKVVRTEIRLSDLNKALKQDRGNAVLYAKRALLYLERNETAKALADINRALALNENKGEYHFRKALILRQAGKIQAARKQLPKLKTRALRKQKYMCCSRSF